MWIGIAAALGFGGRDARRREYSAQLVDFLEKRRCFGARRNLSFRQHFEPECRLVGLFQRTIDFRDELRARPGAARRSIICADARARSPQLTADVVTFIGCWQ